MFETQLSVAGIAITDFWVLKASCITNYFRVGQFAAPDIDNGLRYCLVWTTPLPAFFQFLFNGAMGCI